MAEYYDEQRGIPRRRSATPDAVATRQAQAGSQPAVTRTRRNADDEAYTSSPMRPMVRNFARAPLTPPKREYVIPLTDGTEMHVTERELADMPKEYRQAAVLVTPPPPKRQALPPPQEPHTDDLPRQRRRFRFHWLFFVGLAMFTMLIGWILLTIVANWWTITKDDWQYGRPRTFQIDANVGHGTASSPDSHFIALNLNGHIEVIEIPGDDASKSKIYVGPTLIGQGQDLTPVTLSFADVNHDGRQDVIVHIGDTQYILLNTGTGFKQAPNQ